MSVAAEPAKSPCSHSSEANLSL